MKAILEIRIASEINPIVNTREAALHIATLIQESNCRQVILDFDGVEFISRSFSDQMFKEKRTLSENNILIEIVNASDSVFNMLKIVENTQNNSNRQREEIPIFKITSIEGLSEYLYSI